MVVVQAMAAVLEPGPWKIDFVVVVTAMKKRSRKVEGDGR